MEVSDDKCIIPHDNKTNNLLTVASLLAGERRRLQFLQVIATNPNVLLLDEPSNDLDITTMGVVEDFIANFSGVVVVVSHDVYFLSKSVSTIFAFEGKGVVRCFEGSVGEYMAKRELDKEEGKKGGKGEGGSEAQATKGKNSANTKMRINMEVRKDGRMEMRKEGRPERSDSNTPPAYKINNLPLVAWLLQRERKKLDDKMAKLGSNIKKAEGEYEKAANDGVGWSELAEFEKDVETLKAKLEEVEER